MHLLAPPAPKPIPGTSGNAKRVAAELTVKDEWGHWQIGTLVRHPKVVVELSFEMWHQANLCFPFTPITYVRLDRDEQCLFEFQLGFTIVPPHDSIRDALARMLELWVGHTPITLLDRRRRGIEETEHAYVDSVSTRAPRRASRGRRRGRC